MKAADVRAAGPKPGKCRCVRRRHQCFITVLLKPHGRLDGDRSAAPPLECRLSGHRSGSWVVFGAAKPARRDPHTSAVAPCEAVRCCREQVDNVSCSR